MTAHISPQITRNSFEESLIPDGIFPQYPGALASRKFLPEIVVWCHRSYVHALKWYSSCVGRYTGEDWMPITQLILETEALKITFRNPTPPIDAS
jgi:hypothetical protein